MHVEKLATGKNGTEWIMNGNTIKSGKSRQYYARQVHKMFVVVTKNLLFLCLLLQMNEPGGIDQSHQLNVCVRVLKFSFFWPSSIACDAWFIRLTLIFRLTPIYIKYSTITEVIRGSIRNTLKTTISSENQLNTHDNLTVKAKKISPN